jgi:glycosyltransferase involved in cell wall biosynthesis
MSDGARLAIYCGPLDGNSTAKIAVRLANGFVARGPPTDLLISSARIRVAEPIDPAVEVIDLGRMGVLTRVPRMALYLRSRRPSAILTHRVRENVLTLKAALYSGVRTPVFVTVHGPLSVKLNHLRGRRGASRWRQVRSWYPRNRAIVAISEQTAADMREIFGPAAHIVTIPNPIVAPEVHERAEQPVEHPWLASKTGPVIVSAGRLEYEKDFSALLKAMALLRADLDCRLIIIGEGRLRPELEAECAQLGLDDVVDMPGWAKNPYPYLKAADLVVLSSFWDALPTVLIEALALGTPVVSTACGEGPGEILDRGRLGRLVPPRDPRALADAIAATLADPLPAATLRDGAARYDSRRNADRYRALMLGEPPPPDTTDSPDTPE